MAITASAIGIVDHRERQQANPKRVAGGREGQDAERERGVGRHRRTPAVRPRAARVERRVVAIGTAIPPAAATTRIAIGSLAKLPECGFRALPQADDQEEEGHQALVDPVAKVQRYALAAEPDRELRPPHRLVGVGHGDSPRERRKGGEKQNHGATGLAGRGIRRTGAARLRATPTGR